ncbi:sensor histidine kinase [Winogradskyella sp. A3E31]|uniref:sensor histidine kinase n=1 Tax=Winogradskyella sp. A3E31 TaxID=3349637 RepID=UPI00398AE8D9
MNHNLILLLQEKLATTESERYLIIYVIVVLVVVVAMVILFFVVFQKRKNKLLLEKFEQQRKFDEALVETQQEIQDETLKHIGRELHDNVGQLLALANMQLNAVVRKVDDSLKSKAENAANTLKDSLTEVRALSKSLNSDVIYNMGFDKTVVNEVERINKSGRLQANITIEGDKVQFENKKDEIILFRILQEFFSNTIKYAEAEQLSVKLKYTDDSLIITAEDNGNGFVLEDVEKGSGLINMEKRVELINTTFKLSSEPKKGTSLRLEYPLKR